MGDIYAENHQNDVEEPQARLPGSSYFNPIWFGKWRIYRGDYTPYQFVHDDFDGADDSRDGRHGFGTSVEDCKEQIAEMEADQ